MAIHETFSRRAREETVKLDVLFKPVVRLRRDKELSNLEADVDTVRLECVAEANPVPTVIWRKAGSVSIAGYNTGQALKKSPYRTCFSSPPGLARSWSSPR